MILFLAVLLSAANAQFIDSCFTEPTICEGYVVSGVGSGCIPENRVFSVQVEPGVNCTMAVNGSNTFYIAQNPNGLMPIGLSNVCDFDTVMYGCTSYQNDNCPTSGLLDYGSGTPISPGMRCFPLNTGTTTSGTTTGDNNTTRSNNAFSSPASSLSVIF